MKVTPPKHIPALALNAPGPNAPIHEVVAFLQDDPSRAPGTCDRHADIGGRGVPSVALAVPPDKHPDWPTFRVCAECGHRLACPFHGRGYTLVPLAPGVQ